MAERNDLTVRLRPTEPFHAEIRAAMEGLSDAMFALDSIMEDDGCTAFLESDYGFLIWTTLAIEADGLRGRMAKAFKDAGRDVRGVPLWRD